MGNIEWAVILLAFTQGWMCCVREVPLDVVIQEFRRQNPHGDRNQMRFYEYDLRQGYMSFQFRYDHVRRGELV